MDETWIIDRARADIASRFTVYTGLNAETRCFGPTVVSDHPDPQVPLSELLHRIVTDYGVPEKIITDNGPAFAHRVFTDELQRRGIRHEFRLPFIPDPKGDR